MRDTIFGCFRLVQHQKSIRGCCPANRELDALFLLTGIWLMSVLEIIPAPLSQFSNQRNQCFSEFCQGIFCLWRYNGIYLTMNQLIFLKLTQLKCQCVRCRLRNQSLKLAEAFFAIDEVPQDDRLILSANKAHGRLNCAIELFVRFRSSPQHSILNDSTYLLFAYLYITIVCYIV